MRNAGIIARAQQTRGPCYIVYDYILPMTGRKRRDAKRYANPRGIVDRRVLDTLPPTVTGMVYVAAVNKRDAVRAVASCPRLDRLAWVFGQEEATR